MKLFVLVLIFMFVPSLCMAGIFDDAAEKVNEKVSQSVEQQTDKLMNKVVDGLDKGFDFTVKKLLGFIYWIVQIFAIVGVGWLLSLMCDRDSRTAIRVLVILCAISLTVDKLKSLVN